MFLQILVVLAIGLLTYFIFTKTWMKSAKPTNSNVLPEKSVHQTQRTTKKPAFYRLLSSRRLNRVSELMKAIGMDQMNREAKLEALRDTFTSLEEVSNAIKLCGVDEMNLIFGIDFTKSNKYSGKESFNGQSLHNIDPHIQNPYQRVISILGKTLEPFGENRTIKIYGFGCSETQDFKAQVLASDCKSFQDVFACYNRVAPTLQFDGPTDFSPLIREAIRIAEEAQEYHILIIIADGQVTAQKKTRDALREASYYPLSIIMVGVGDGPWDSMEDFDDKVSDRNFDNFQFVQFEDNEGAANNDEAFSLFALNALMEIPDQYREIVKLGLLKEESSDKYPEPVE